MNANAQNPEEDADLYGQITTLQEQLHIDIRGIEHIENHKKVRISGSLEQRLQQLLAGFNHLDRHNADGKLVGIVILNKKTPRKAHRIVLPTRQEGNHLIVSVNLSGDGRLWQPVDMLIDTGADVVVLPESMIVPLGLTDSQLTKQIMQTANGKTPSKTGILAAVNIGGETITDVEAAFIADKLLGNSRLLGMSVLGRYQIAIDDKTHLMTLFTK